MDDMIHELKSAGTIRAFQRGSNVLFQGEVPRHVMIVRSGIIKAYTITSGGEERTVSLHGEGDILPLSWALGVTSTTLFYYEAVTDSRVLQVSRASFDSYIKSEPERAYAMLKHNAKLYTSLLLRITGLEQSRAAEKIGFTLYYLLFTRGSEIKPGIFRIEARLSHALFGSLVGLTRESTAKNMKALRDKGIIEYSSFTYTVNKSKLEGFLGEDGFRELVG